MDNTWPEQDAAELWWQDHRMELKNSVSQYRMSKEKEITALRTRLAEVEKERDCMVMQARMETPSGELLRRALEAEEGKKQYMALVNQAQFEEDEAHKERDEAIAKLAESEKEKEALDIELRAEKYTEGMVEKAQRDLEGAREELGNIRQEIVEELGDKINAALIGFGYEDQEGDEAQEDIVRSLVALIKVRAEKAEEELEKYKEEHGLLRQTLGDAHSRAEKALAEERIHRQGAEGQEDFERTAKEKFQQEVKEISAWGREKHEALGKATTKHRQDMAEGGRPCVCSICEAFALTKPGGPDNG